MKIIFLIAVGLAWAGVSPSDRQAIYSSTPVANECAGCFPQELQGLTGIVEGQTLASPGMPSVRLKFDPAFKYAGRQSFILYDVAHAEKHFFVDADKAGRIKRMYWIQFESYLPSNTNIYKYPVTKNVNLAGLDFIADAYARNVKANPGRPDSDGNRARAFLESKGYRMASDEVISQRLVHLVDESKRNELTIIYREDLSALGFTAADIAAGGKAFAKWNQMSQELLERALKNMQISRS